MPAPPAAPERVDLDAGTIHYRDSGSGPTIVFAHGLLVDGSLWRKVTPLLDGEFRCVVPDLPQPTMKMGRSVWGRSTATSFSGRD